MCPLYVSLLYLRHLSVCIYPLFEWVLYMCITPACVSILSPYESSLFVYHVSACISPPCVSVLRVYQSSVCIYPLSVWVLSLCVLSLRVYTPPPNGSSLCLYPVSVCISSPAPSRRVFILPAYCGGMEAQARSGRRQIVYDAILRSDRGKPQTG